MAPGRATTGHRGHPQDRVGRGQKPSQAPGSGAVSPPQTAGWARHRGHPPPRDGRCILCHPRGRVPGPARASKRTRPTPAPASRPGSVSRCIRAYKVLVLAVICGQLPVRARLRRLHGRGHRPVRTAAGKLAGRTEAWPLPSARWTRVRPGSPPAHQLLVQLTETPASSMERRVLLAISLSFLVLFAYQTYFAPPPPRAGRHAQRRRRPCRRLPARRWHLPPSHPDLRPGRGRRRGGRVRRSGKSPSRLTRCVLSSRIAAGASKALAAEAGPAATTGPTPRPRARSRAREQRADAVFAAARGPGLHVGRQRGPFP